MIESGVTEGINKFYFVLKLSIYFWTISLLGGIFLGVGPAFLTIMDFFREYGWDYKAIKIKALIPKFKENFGMGNKIMYVYLGTLFFLFLSLWTSGQLVGMLFLMIDFVLVCLMIVTIVAWYFANALASVYEISFVNLWKLSYLLFFKEFKAVFSVILFTVIIVLVNYKLPAFIFFVSAGASGLFLVKLGFKMDSTLVIE